MHFPSLRVAAFVSLAVASLTAAPAGLHGTTHVGALPEPNAVVWLDAASPTPSPGTSRAVLEQRNLEFYPAVLAVRVGTVVKFPNDDRVFHNVFSFHDGKKFDLGLYPVGTVKYVTFDHPGLSRIFCNIHPNMAAYVVAVATPYFSVSDQDGRFVIPDVPAGTYTYHAWRPGRTDLTGTVQVDSGTSLNLEWR
jgi:plastocyanin